ncbi:MAG: hypothetical protein RR032_07785 [Oscillospiraceae bacterium]
MENTLILSDCIDYMDKLPGVINSNIVMNGEELTEIHVLSDVSRSPKQIVRDIQSLFMAKFQKEVDHKIVSIAQIDISVAARSVPRLVIEEICVSKKKGDTQVTVSLSRNGKTFTDARSCANDKLEIIRAIAQATLNSASVACESTYVFSVSDARFIDVPSGRVALVCVAARAESGTINRCSGSAFVEDDDNYAIVKASLAAVNRKISRV